MLFTCYLHVIYIVCKLSIFPVNSWYLGPSGSLGKWVFGFLCLWVSGFQCLWVFGSLCICLSLGLWAGPLSLWVSGFQGVWGHGPLGHSILSLLSCLYESYRSLGAGKGMTAASNCSFIY